jgi:hypothetical protein
MVTGFPALIYYTRGKTRRIHVHCRDSLPIVNPREQDSSAYDLSH